MPDLTLTSLSWMTGSKVAVLSSSFTGLFSSSSAASVVVDGVDPHQGPAEEACIVEQEAVNEVIEEIVEHQDDEHVEQDPPPRLGFQRQAEGQDQAEDHQQVHRAPLAVPFLVFGIGNSTRPVV